MSDAKETPESKFPSPSFLFLAPLGLGSGLGLGIWALFAGLGAAAAYWANNRPFFAMLGTLSVLLAIAAYAIKNKDSGGGHDAGHGHAEPKNQPKKADKPAEAPAAAKAG